ncbi:MAG TPA: ATP synthase F1 subunit gamma [Candidatus Gastranaerophilales bacterium]|nr:ATP synthase F1 subunit gamma [Candidatus Gastranaerophilales bacterium]
MPNLKDIKRRIKSVQNTQKITRAMKMVAAAKVKKAEAMLKASMPYSDELLNIMRRLMSARPYLEDTSQKFYRAIDNYPELLKERELKTVGILVITSDKGLAGAYNANVVRKAQLRIKELELSGIKAKLFILGNKGYQALKRTESSKIVKFYTKLPAIPTPGACSVIAEEMAESYVSGEIDKIEIITTYFKSSLSFEVQVWQLLPMIFSSETQKGAKTESEMLFEPNMESVLQKIIPLYISNRIYHAVIEAVTSEQAARMQAMSSATNNARDMIKILTIDYNKARQASITQELLEVVNGAEALRG